MSIKIWGKYKNLPVEELDEADDQKTADSLVGEYRMAYDKDWSVWSGKKTDGALASARSLELYLKPCSTSR